jgi:aspartate carbamoyltransferase catalytic subunit
VGTDAGPQATEQAAYRSLVDILDLDGAEVERILSAAAWYLPQVQAGGFKHDTLKGTSALLLFYEASTRTRASFELAGKMLGSDTINVGAKGSSAEKGESVKDTALTLNAMDHNVVVMRHASADAVRLFARHFERGVLSAGAGRGQHPTQALLDALALRQVGLLARGKRLAIVGDIRNSRVMRSNIQLLSTLGLDVVLVAPPQLMPQYWEGLKPEYWAAPERGSSETQLAPAAAPSGEARLKTRAPGDYGAVSWHTDIDAVLPTLDAVMLLRVQRERMDTGLLTNTDEYSKLYGLNRRRLKLLPEHAVIMHPGPVNRGVEIGEDAFLDPRCRINDQVTSGVAVRCALLGWACGRLPDGARA